MPERTMSLPRRMANQAASPITTGWRHFLAQARSAASWKAVVAVSLLAWTLARASAAMAAGSATTDLRVTCAVSLSVHVGTAAYDFGQNLGTNQTAISTGAVPVQNDSLGLTEDLQINGSDTADWQAQASTNTGTNKFNLRVLVSTDGVTVPLYNDFSTTNTGLLPGTPQNLTNAAFGRFAAGDGNNVAAGIYRYLWFRMITPAQISQGNNTQESVTVTVTAAPASTY